MVLANSDDTNADLMKARIELDLLHAQGWFKGRHLRKTEEDIEILLDHFKADPVWNYETKVKIALQVGMTLNQVSKWHWDHRKKLGISTKDTRTRKYRIAT